MQTVTLTQARAHLSDIVDQTRVQREPVYLTRRNRPVAAVIASDWLDQLLTMEAERTGASPNQTSDHSEADQRRVLEELAARATERIEPGTPPLLDADEFYQQREPRL